MKNIITKILVVSIFLITFSFTTSAATNDTVQRSGSHTLTLTDNPFAKSAAEKSVPTVFKKVFKRAPTSKESNYWLTRARTDKKTSALLQQTMQWYKSKKLTMSATTK